MWGIDDGRVFEKHRLITQYATTRRANLIVVTARGIIPRLERDVKEVIISISKKCLRGTPVGHINAGRDSNLP